jgi:two-component system phosphate regulon sensor histidine kinase PhoR
MAERTRREQLLTFLLTPIVVLAVVVLAVITFRTTFQIEKLRQRSVLEATLSLANEKTDRLDKRIIEEDNVVIAETETASPGTLARRWLPTAGRETPTVRAVLILEATGDHDVLDFASRAPGPEDDAFRRLFVHRIIPNLELARPPVEELRHLHKVFDSQSYLISYWQRQQGDRRYLIAAWHDVPRIVHDLFPRLFEDTDRHARLHVVDEEGRTVFGSPKRGSEFTVGRPFQTTLYSWRLQVALTAAEELGASVERRRELEMITVAFSFLVVVIGVITVVVAAERERRLAALKSDFVANVSHELKTPLALVRMFSELLASDRIRTEEKRAEYLSIIVAESERLTALIENVLDFARLERGKTAYQFSEGQLTDVVARAVDIYRYRAEREGVEIVLELTPDLPSTLIDERALELALVNLLDNALKYAKDGKKIEVRLGYRGSHHLEIAVKDHGPGIAPEDQRRIFQRFVRGKGARDRQVRGSGIGLSLVEHIARSHKGQIWVESRPGEGATFLLTIPIRNESRYTGNTPEGKRGASN